MKVLLLLLLMAAPLSAQVPVHANMNFAVPTTWSTKIGSTLAARNAVFAAPTAGSANLIADLQNNAWYGFINQSAAWVPAFCIASNADPLETVTFSGTPNSAQIAFQVTTGNNVLRIPASCTPPVGNDGLAVIANTDDPNWVWTFYRLEKISVGGGAFDWRMAGVHKWARTEAAAHSRDSDPNSGYDMLGRAMGISPTYVAWSASSSACPNSPGAIMVHGTVHGEDLAAGVIPHALSFVQRENGNDHYKLYPCQATQVTGADPGPANPARTYASYTGERLMLDPSLNINTFCSGCGAATKAVLVALQEYGQMMVDSTDEHEYYFLVANDATTAQGYDYKAWGAGTPYADNDAFLTAIFANSKWLPCVEAFAGECAAGDPPPSTPGTLTITDTSPLPSGEVGTPYSHTLTVTGGTAPYTLTQTTGTLPTSVAMSTGGVFSGTPTVDGAFTFNAHAVDSTSPTALTADRSLSITIATPPPPAPDPDLPPNVNVTGLSYLPGTVAFNDQYFNSNMRLKRSDALFIRYSVDPDLFDPGDAVHIYWRVGDAPFRYIASPLYDATDAQCTIDPSDTVTSGCLEISPTTEKIPASNSLQFLVCKQLDSLWCDLSQPFRMKGANLK